MLDPLPHPGRDVWSEAASLHLLPGNYPSQGLGLCRAQEAPIGPPGGQHEVVISYPQGIALKVFPSGRARGSLLSLSTRITSKAAWAWFTSEPGAQPWAWKELTGPRGQTGGLLGSLCDA